MEIPTIWSEAERYARRGDYDGLRDAVASRIAGGERDNDYLYLYNLTQLDEMSMADGKTSILRRTGSARKAVEAIKELRRMVMRMEWCPEYGKLDFMNFLEWNGYTTLEISWVISTVCMQSDEILTYLHSKKRWRKIERAEVPWDDSREEAVTFVICTNDKREFQEAEYYIKRLYCPPGIRVGISEIVGASSICSGYNQAMRASGAKYKVYLHQDVRILNPYFLYDTLNIFRRDETIGFVGVVGSRDIALSGYIWDVPQYGNVIEAKINMVRDYQKENLLAPYPDHTGVRVRAVDGLLMATQYDIPWREDLFDGWDFYDASQGMEFYRHGYDGFVPWQEEAWCFHDCGILNWKNVDKYRRVFVKEYFPFAPEVREGRI